MCAAELKAAEDIHHGVSKGTERFRRFHMVGVDRMSRIDRMNPHPSWTVCDSSCESCASGFHLIVRSLCGGTERGSPPCLRVSVFPW